MADSIIQLQDDGSGNIKLDTEQLTVGANTVDRERNQIAGALAAEIAAVLNADPATSVYGLVVRVLQGTADRLNAQVVGDIAHGTADAGKPVKGGGKAINYGTTPTPVAADARTDFYANRHGIPWYLSGHPNSISFEYVVTIAKTNAAIIDSVAANDRIILTSITAKVSNKVKEDVKVRIGFGATAVPTEPTDGNSVNGMVLSDPGIAKGSGLKEPSGGNTEFIGGKGDELRITCTIPRAGQLTVSGSYFLITES